MYRSTERWALAVLTALCTLGCYFSPAPEPFAVALVFVCALWAVHFTEE